LRTGNREHDNPRLGGRVVHEPDTHAFHVLRRDGRGEGELECGGNGADGSEQAKVHQRIRLGSKLKKTGRMSSVKPSGSGPNARARPAASTEPSASWSNMKSPERFTSLRSAMEPSRLILKKTSAT